MKNIIITGAGGGVGSAVARALKSENLLLVGKDEKRLLQLQKELNCKSFLCDVSDVDDVRKLKDFVTITFGSVDILINCAAVWTKGEISQLSEDHFKSINTLERLKELITTNTFGLIAMTTTFAPMMMENGQGYIININSQSAVDVEEFCPVYNASKHGGYSYRKAVQRDLAKHNVKITDVCPGLIKTDFYVNANDKLSDEIMALGLEATDVANVIEYLLSLPQEITIPSIEIRNIKNY